MTDFKNFSLQNTVANIEGQMDSGDLPLDEDDDVIPQAAADMGTGTLVNCVYSNFQEYIISLFYRLLLHCKISVHRNFILYVLLSENF